MTTNVRPALDCCFRLPGDPWSPTSMLGNHRLGRLTTDHSQSCHGLPVVVGEDGTAYGPGEVEEVLLSLGDLYGDERAEGERLVAAAKAAGYAIPGH